MQNLLDDLKELLKQDDRLMVEDELLKNKIIELALKLDESLIRLLLSHSRLRQHFFADIDGVLVFDKQKFLQFVSNKAFLPDSYTAFKNKIGLTDDGGTTYVSRHRDVVLAWPYKDCVLEGGQTEEDAKRDEIFWNETLAPDDIDRLLDPKVLTNFRRIDADGEHPVKGIADTDNLIIKGNNLLALHSLLPRFRGQVKLIYIDPPYNTGNDSFGYNDRFNHSTWLTFMENRLSAAKQLLGDDGAIFVSINYIELPYLMAICDEIFGRDNFVSLVTIQVATTASYRSINVCPVNVSEYLLVYARDRRRLEMRPLYVETDYSEDYAHFIENFEDSYTDWQLTTLNEIIYEKQGVKNWREFRDKFGERWKQVRFELKSQFAIQKKERVVSLNTLQKPSRAVQEMIEYSRLNRGKVFRFERGDKKPPIYIYNGRTLAFYGGKVREVDGELAPTEILTNIWSDISFLSLGLEGGVDFPNGKKPERLLKRIIELTTEEGDLVLDYHLGSGTTVAAAHKMGRQYIGIEQLDYGENDSIVRLKNVIAGDQSGISKDIDWQGGGDFVTCDLMEWNARHVEQIQTVQSTEELQALWEMLRAEGFLSYKVDFAQFNEHAEEFSQLSLADQKRFLLEVLDKNQLYINLSEIDDADYQVSDEDKRLNRQLCSTEQN